MIKKTNKLKLIKKLVNLSLSLFYLNLIKDGELYTKYLKNFDLILINFVCFYFLIF